MSTELFNDLAQTKSLSKLTDQQIASTRRTFAARVNRCSGDLWSYIRRLLG